MFSTNSRRASAAKGFAGMRARFSIAYFHSTDLCFTSEFDLEKMRLGRRELTPVKGRLPIAVVAGAADEDLFISWDDNIGLAIGRG